MTATTDNRELRALVQKWRDLAQKSDSIDLQQKGQIFRWCANDLEALLARTEAASVADAELPGMWSTSDFTGGDPDERSYSERAAVGEVIVYDSYRGAILYGAEHCTLASGTKLYTHPQDASGDAREAERYRWLRDEASRAQLEMFADRRGTRLAADRLCDAGIDIAMQAKEAPNRSAMMRDDEMRGSECEKACDYWLRFKEQDGGMSPWYRCSLEQYARARRQHDSDTCVTKKGETP